MLDKVKALPHKKIFVIGFVLVLISGMLSFDFWPKLISGTILGFGFLLIIIATDKKLSSTDK